MSRIIQVVVVTLVPVVGIASFLSNREADRTSARLVRAEANRIFTVKSKQFGFPVYPFSVVPGGIHSPEDLNAALTHDQVVRTHYSNFERIKVRFVRNAEDRFQYVSYRRGDQVFWTRQKLLIPKGEVLFTDGHAWARSRCGNRLANAFPADNNADVAPPHDFVLNFVVGFRPLPLDQELELAKATPPEVGSPLLTTDHLAALEPAVVLNDNTRPFPAPELGQLELPLGGDTSGAAPEVGQPELPLDWDTSGALLFIPFGLGLVGNSPPTQELPIIPRPPIPPGGSTIPEPEPVVLVGIFGIVLVLCFWRRSAGRTT